MGIKLRVWGDYALFTRPEFGTERYSYDVMTPSAARGLIESIYWHPGMRWIIDKIHVIKPIKFMSIKTNEIKERGSTEKALKAMNGSNEDIGIIATDQRIQRNNMILENVEYVIEAHFEMTENKNPLDCEEKFMAIVGERIKKGRCYHIPYFGCKRYSAYFEKYNDKKQEKSYYADIEEKDLGLMLYDMDYSDPKNIKPMFFKAVMKNGVIDVSGSEVIRDGSAIVG